MVLASTLELVPPENLRCQVLQNHMVGNSEAKKQRPTLFWVELRSLHHERKEADVLLPAKREIVSVRTRSARETP